MRCCVNSTHTQPSQMHNAKSYFGTTVTDMQFYKQQQIKTMYSKCCPPDKNVQNINIVTAQTTTHVQQHLILPKGGII